MHRAVKTNPKFGIFETYITTWILSGFLYFVFIAIGSIFESNKSILESFQNFDSFLIIAGPIFGGILGVSIGLPGLAICKMFLSGKISNFFTYFIGATVYGTLVTLVFASFFNGFGGGKYSGSLVLLAMPAAAIGGTFFWCMMTEPDKSNTKYEWGRN